MLRNKIMAGLATFTPTTWNPADKTAGVTLSSGNLVATNTGSGVQCVRSVASQSTGKFYIELTASNAAGTNYSFGIGNASADFTQRVGNTTDSQGAVSSIPVWIYNAAGSGATVTYATTDVISFAIDLVDSQIWMRKNGGTWRGSSAGGDPSANTLGQPISPTGPFFIMVDVQDNSSVCAANFGASAFSFAVPTGFVAGFG